MSSSWSGCLSRSTVVAILAALNLRETSSHRASAVASVEGKLVGFWITIDDERIVSNRHMPSRWWFITHTTHTPERSDFLDVAAYREIYDVPGVFLK
jgi:hypothetical protein